MRTETIKIYKFNELPEESKQKAIEKYRIESGRLGDYPWVREIVDSFRAVFGFSGIHIKNYSIGDYNSYVEFDMDDGVRQLSGNRARTWLENNLFSRVRISRNDYMRNRKNYFCYGSAYRIGKIKPCPFTGYCADEDFIEDLKESIDSGETLERAYKLLAHKATKLIEAEIESQLTDEYISETLSINDYEFTENGEMY